MTNSCKKYKTQIRFLFYAIIHIFAFEFFFWYSDRQTDRRTHGRTDGLCWRSWFWVQIWTQVRILVDPGYGRTDCDCEQFRWLPSFVFSCPSEYFVWQFVFQVNVSGFQIYSYYPILPSPPPVPNLRCLLILCSDQTHYNCIWILILDMLWKGGVVR